LKEDQRFQMSWKVLLYTLLKSQKIVKNKLKNQKIY